MEATINWWVYFIIVISVFSGCLLLNYMVKKFNEVQLDNRLIMLQLRSPAGQVIQVPGPPLETGSRYPQEEPKPAVVDAKKRAKPKKTTVSEVHNIEAKPIFLGNIYSELMEAKPSNGDIKKAHEDILNDVLERAMAKIDDSKPQTVPSRAETLESKNIDKKSEITILNPEVQNNEIVSNSIAMSDLLDHVVMLK